MRSQRECPEERDLIRADQHGGDPPGRRGSAPRPGPPKGGRRSATRASWRLAGAAAALVGLAVGACSLAPQSSGSRANLINSDAPSGWIRIGTASPLRFEATTCSAHHDRFVAVGRGMDGGEKFVVRVRATGLVEVLYGTHDEMRQEQTSLHRLTAQPADVEADGQVISGTAELINSAEPQEPAVPARLRITCA